MAVVPLYAWREGELIIAETPLVPGVKFKGKTSRELHDDVRAVWPSLAAQAVENATPIMEKHDAEYSTRDGSWITVLLTPTNGADTGRERVNISMQTHLIKQIDRAARDIGTSRSGYIAIAVREKLQRGI